MSLCWFKNITDVAIPGLLVQRVPGTVCLNSHPVCSAPDKHRVTQGTRRPMSQCYNKTCGIMKLQPSSGEWQAFLEPPFSLTKGGPGWKITPALNFIFPFGA